MDLSVITTYRCDSRCSMCHIWKNPTHPDYELDGFNRKVETMKKLMAAGGTDLGFATTFQDENIDEVVDVYKFATDMGLELATSALHNAFQFHKNDNYIYDRINVAKKVEVLI